MIVPDLEPLAVPIIDVKHLTGNPRRGDVDAVRRSLERFGQRKPIVARRDTGEVIAGNHTLMAARALGWDQIAVVWVTDDDTTAKAFALADNRTSELGGYDDEALAAMIADVRADDEELLAATSYSVADLDALLSETTTAPPDVEVAGDPTGSSEGLTGAAEGEGSRGPATRVAPIKLADRFLGLPVSVLNSREGWWQDRKRAWTALGIESELGRDGKALTWNLTVPPGHGHQATDLVAKEG